LLILLLLILLILLVFIFVISLLLLLIRGRELQLVAVPLSFGRADLYKEGFGGRGRGLSASARRGGSARLRSARSLRGAWGLRSGRQEGRRDLIGRSAPWRCNRGATRRRSLSCRAWGPCLPLSGEAEAESALRAVDAVERLNRLTELIIEHRGEGASRGVKAQLEVAALTGGDLRDEPVIIPRAALERGGLPILEGLGADHLIVRLELVFSVRAGDVDLRREAVLDLTEPDALEARDPLACAPYARDVKLKLSVAPLDLDLGAVARLSAIAAILLGLKEREAHPAGRLLVLIR
jgi:hypothetical protein